MKRILGYYNYFLKESFYSIKSNYNYEWVKTTTLWNYREFDRSDRQFNVDKLKDILSNEGFNEPLILQYSHKFKTTYLIEGNHRLLAAIQLGIKYVPVRVTIDGVENKDAHPVVGYYSEEEKVDPRLPSEIGIPDCLDKNGNTVESETRIIEEDSVDINYDELLSKYPDVEKFEKIEDGCYNIWVKMRWWDIHFFMDSDTYDNIDAALSDNKNAVLGNIKSYFTDFLDGDYFTDEMMEFLELPKDITRDDLNEYFNTDFYESSYYENYYNEVGRIVWEKYKEKNVKNFLYGGFATPYDGIIDWWLEKPYVHETYNYKGIHISNELLECYDNDCFEHATFLNVLKVAYKGADVFEEWSLNKLRYKITPNMLVFSNIFK
ncbi:MAG: ParB-like nuclease domain [Bacteroidota bacterium]